MAALREYLRYNIQLAMDFVAVQAKRWYNGKYRPIEFEVGNKVYFQLYCRYYLLENPLYKYS